MGRPVIVAVKRPPFVRDSSTDWTVLWVADAGTAARSRVDSRRSIASGKTGGFMVITIG